MKQRSQSQKQAVGPLPLQQQVADLKEKLEKSEGRVESLLEELKRAKEEIEKVQDEEGEDRM